MKKTSNNFYNMAIVDPEYGINYAEIAGKKSGKKYGLTKRGNYKIKKWDANPPDTKYFNELFRVSKKQIIFGANYFKELCKPAKPPRRKEFERFLKKHPRGFIIWDKINFGNRFSDCEVIYTSFSFESFVLPFMWNGMLQAQSVKSGRVCRGNKKLNEKRIHPTQKPIVLYKWLLKNYANPGDKIFDSHVGSGSIRISCHYLGFDFEGCELDSEYWSDQEKRYREHVTQGELFSNKEIQKLIYE